MGLFLTLLIRAGAHPGTGSWTLGRRGWVGEGGGGGGGGAGEGGVQEEEWLQMRHTQKVNCVFENEKKKEEVLASVTYSEGQIRFLKESWK